MELVKHIRDLLYHHDCVVVPGFGGFVTNERAARIDKSADSFYPPSREVGFNARLDHNDGLLISYLSARLSLNYVDTRSLVEKFAADVNRKLEEGRVVNFDGIGQFSVTRQGSLQFAPDPSANFLTDAYGLSFFRYPSLDDAAGARRVRSRKVRTGERRTSSGARRLLKYAAVGIPLIAALAWGAMNRDVIREFSFSLSSLNPFSAVVDTNLRSMPEGEEEVAWPDDHDLLPPDVTSQRDALMYEEPAPVATRTHYLVAGSFRSRQNALILSERLALEGYETEVVDAENGLHRVSLYSSTNSNEALGMLRRIRSREGMEDVWMLSR